MKEGRAISPQREGEENMKPIIIKSNEEEYTLEFSRESVKFAESRGFKFDDVANFPMTKLPELFFYAFRMHHKNIARDKTDKILFEELGGIPDGMIERLAELYAKPFEALNVVEEGEERKNSKWSVEM